MRRVPGTPTSPPIKAAHQSYIRKEKYCPATTHAAAVLHSGYPSWILKGVDWRALVEDLSPKGEQGSAELGTNTVLKQAK